jgi:hypothetical protein
MADNIEQSIGIPGQKWGDTEKKQWLIKQEIKRSYQDDVVNKINAMSLHFDIVQYGALNINVQRYPLFALKSKGWQSNNKTILVTGGVHGYETSGVQGALRFLENQLSTHGVNYGQLFNLLVIPCVSPWAYETINRWNYNAVDPNRSFYAGSPAQESADLMAFIQSLSSDIFVHIDLHETTDTDNTVFRPSLSARDAIEQKVWNIPDGFYLVGNSDNPQAEFQSAIINGVEQVTHIAPADDNDKLIGVDIEQFGVINYEAKKLGLCMGLTNANFVTTTEVYPDSPKVNDENCILAQVAAVNSALDYVITHNK